MRTQQRNFAAAGILILATLAPMAPAEASLGARLQRTLSAGSADWAAVAVVQGGAPAATPYTLTWARLNKDHTAAWDFFDVVNTGSVDLAGQRLVISPAAGTVAPPLVSIDLCQDGTWNAGTNVCSSANVVHIGATANGTLASIAAIASQTRLSLRASTTDVKAVGSKITTISVSVARSDARPAESHHS